MYKNFNSSSDYSQNVFELFKKVKQVDTKFNKDQKSYNENEKENKKINKKDVNLNKVKVDKDTSMRTSKRVVPLTIKSIEKGLIIMILALLGMHIWNIIMEYQLLIPAAVLSGVIIVCSYGIWKGIKSFKKKFR